MMNASGHTTLVSRLLGAFGLRSRGTSLLFVALVVWSAALSGCGGGGYAGTSGLQSLSRASAVIDAGQQLPVSATVNGGALGWSLSGPGCSGAGCGTLSAASGAQVVYTAPGGLTQTMQVTLTASMQGINSSKVVAITVNPDPVIGGTPPAGVVGTVYGATLTATGGTPPLRWSLASGTLPPGLTFSTESGAISGTPTLVGSFAFTVQAVDSSDVPFTVTAPKNITITTPVATLTLSGAPASGTVGTAYTAQLTANGGTAPYAFSVLSGALPTGLTLSATTGLISGTPTTAGTFTSTAQVQDATGAKATVALSILIKAATAPLTLTTTGLPNGTVGVPYSATIGVSGGTAPYSCQFTAGTLPAGLALNGCVVSGTPTAAGTSNLTVKATDAGSPAATTSGPIAITIGASGMLTIGSPGSGTVGQPYSGAIPVSGGTAPYTCALASGTLPAGLSLNGCVLTGTPTAPGTTTFNITATDSGQPKLTQTGPVTVVINPAALAITTGTLPAGTVAVPYSQTIGVSGGAAPYNCQITSGTLQSGLSLNGCTVSGTPTAAGTVVLQVKATDAASTTTNGPVSLTINPATVTLVLGNPPAGTVGTPFTGSIPVTGGSGPYTCALVSGTVPAGLTLNPNCSFSGTPTAPGTTPVQVKATDSSNPGNTTTGPVSVTINPAPATTITVGNPPACTVGAVCSSPIPITGGNPPYTCSLQGGTLPAGLSLNGCTIVGTPTAPITAPIQIGVIDGSNPPVTVTAPITVTVNPAAKLTLTGATPNAVLNQPYSTPLAAAGGVGPYTYAVTAGTLNPGLTLNPNTGVISGTPTTPGASSFTVTATDSEATPQTANLPLVLLVTYGASANSGELKGPYAFLFQGYDDVTAGVFAFGTATAGSITADGLGGITAGEQDANHQGSNPTGATVTTNGLIGTYTINADQRGLLTLTTINADGTTGRSRTYAIAVKAPVSPATTAAQGSLIEFDDNQLAGTKGSGTLLQQTGGAALNGSYAFGFNGDTPCLPACTVGVVAGPAAQVGQASFTGGTVSGATDAIVASGYLANTQLTGSYAAADANGRVQVSMVTANTATGVYPQDYAVYVVDANRALVVSTDKHSQYVLLAGSMQLQTQAAFSNASLNGPFIGYENSLPNPGLVSATLTNVLNFSTATIFRATATADSTCFVTNVDVGGADSLVANLTGLGGSLTGLNNVLGTFKATGQTTCPVAANGRGVLAYPQQTLLGLPVGTAPAPRVLYLSSPNSGYFLETGYAGLGRIEPQTGSPFGLGSFKGTYVFASQPASSLASINTSGVITADGAGNDTSTVDTNIGVGTLNVLQVGVATPGTYTTPDPVTGRFTLNNSTTVVYTLNPGRYVLVDTNPLTTSPSVTLLY